MADIVKGLKSVWMRGMEAIGDTASNIANNTKYKVQEMNLINRRHEILSDFGTHAYALWQSGMKFPKELEKQLGIKAGSVTPDGKFSIDACRCIGACGLAPVMTIDGEVHAKMTPDAALALLEQIRKEESAQ